MDDLVARLRERLARATPRPWQLQDGCSWRRIGTQRHDGDVLCPTNSPTDRHPDLTSGRGQDTYANLHLIVDGINALPDLLDAIERLQAELAEAVAKEREACAAIMDERAAMYRGKAAKRDPFAEDSLTEHERFISNAEASEYGSAAIRERT